MNTKLLILLVLVLVIVGGVVAYIGITQNDAQADWKLYENEKFKVSFLYPPNLELYIENDSSDLGLSTSFISNDGEVVLGFGLSLDVNDPGGSSQERIDNFLNYLDSEEAQFVFDKPGEILSERVRFNGRDYVKWGNAGSDYGFTTYDEKNIYIFSLYKPVAIEESTSEIIRYKEGVLSDSDFEKIVESFTFK